MAETIDYDVVAREIYDTHVVAVNAVGVHNPSNHLTHTEFPGEIEVGLPRIPEPVDESAAVISQDLELDDEEPQKQKPDFKEERRIPLSAFVGELNELPEADIELQPSKVVEAMEKLVKFRHSARFNQ